MVVGQLGAIDIGLAELVAAAQARERSTGLRMLQLLQNARQLGHHILGDMAALGARIGDQLVGLVQGLGVFQDLRGSKAEAAVGVALQIVEVVERGRAVLFDLLLNLEYPARLVRTELAVQPLSLLLLLDASLAILAVLGRETLLKLCH